jgi:hypothetical protein
MTEYEERLGADLPLERIEQMKEGATRSIDDFTVSFVLDEELAGSGTLVDAFGTLGILTAFHVADKLDTYADRSLCLIIARHFHRFELPRECLRHIPVGQPSEDKRHHDQGPDLSFLKLTGEPTLSTIKSKKSFYRIRENPLGSLADMPLEKIFWWIAGAPESRAARSGPDLRESVALRAVHLVAQADYRRLKPNGKFDVLTLNINAETSPFPSNYRGCSGGGVWASSLAIDPLIGDETLEITPAILAGVAYYQGDLVAGRRDIIANGPSSLQQIGEAISEWNRD